MSRNGVPARVLPITLEEPVHRLRFPLSAGEPITLHICEFVERYEAILEQTRPPRTILTVRQVIESGRWNAPHLPLCPVPPEHEHLPENEVDCVSCTFEFDANFFSTACFTVRMIGRPTLITAELYLTAAPKLIGMVPMEIHGIYHLISSLGDGAGPSTYRQQNPHTPDKANLEWVKKRGMNVVHFVENALDLAAVPLQELSVRSRMAAVQGPRPSPSPRPQAQNPARNPVGQPASAPPPPPVQAAPPPAASPAPPPASPAPPQAQPVRPPASPSPAVKAPSPPQHPKIKRRG